MIPSVSRGFANRVQRMVTRSSAPEKEAHPERPLNAGAKENAPAFTGAFSKLNLRLGLVAPTATAAAATVAAATAAAAPTAAAATVAATATTAAAVALPATATAAEVFARTRFIHGQVATLEVFAMKCADGFLRFLIRGHGDEGKSAGLARGAVLHERGFAHGSSLSKEFLEVVLGRVEGKIPDV